MRVLWKCPFLFADRFKQALLSASKITADGDCSHEIKRCLLLGRKTVTNLDSILKTRDTTLTIRTFVNKVMSLLFNMLSRFATAFLPRNKHLLILWLQSLSAVILVISKIGIITFLTL